MGPTWPWPGQRWCATSRSWSPPRRASASRATVATWMQHEPLAAGDELAVIPPVAGGAEAGERRRHIAIVESALEPGCLDDLRARVASPADGAVVLFLGQTRETAGTPAPGQEAEAARFAGQRVTGLSYEAFEPMALAVLGEIADEVEARFGVRRLAIVHRVGDVAVGEASVAIAVAAAHREQAFAACRYALEELKARAPIWKAERFADGSVWLGTPARHGPAAAWRRGQRTTTATWPGVRRRLALGFDG